MHDTAPADASQPTQEQYAWASDFCGIDVVAAAPGGSGTAQAADAPDDGIIPARPLRDVVDEALHGPPEYVPSLNIDPAILASEDKKFEGAEGERFKALVQDAATKVGLDPGLLAAALLAEEARGSFTKTSGEQDTFTIGADDYLSKRAEIERRIPAAKEIKITPIGEDENEQTRKVKSGAFRADQAVLVDAVYLKHGELKVRDAFEAQGADFDTLTPELKFAFTRLAMNPGKTPVAEQVKKFLATRDIADTAPDILIRTGIKGQDARKPQSGATRVSAIGVHLSQKVFGNVYTASSLSLAPPQRPVR